MIGPRPVPPARWVLACAMLVLPAGAARERYREEFRTELCHIGAGAQVFQAASLLVGSMALRSAVLDQDLPARSPARPWRCRIGWHSYAVVRDDNREVREHRYLQCRRCGRPKDPPEYGRPVITSLAGSGGAVGGGAG